MDLDFIEYIEQKQQIIQGEIMKRLNELSIPNDLKESMLYSFTAGGKKIRPILLMASYEAYSANTEKVFAPAVALEMIHTYSLIHDDLPAMDNDDFRRGKPTNHKAFDEATAILAGDALLTHSFEIITADKQLTDVEKVHLVKSLASASGPKGMVAGQMLDMEAENKVVTLEQLEKIHTLKTGELLKFAIWAGAYLGGASQVQLEHLDDFAHYLGLVFQVQDDILDVTGDPEKMGKPVGSDEGNLKSTYPNLLGLDGALLQKELYVNKARESLIKADADTSNLLLLTDFLTKRDH